MKSILISTQPKWCDLIAREKKTVEVRKTKPKLETPFKCYIYCTKDKNNWFFPPIKKPTFRKPNYYEDLRGNGKVIGEFVCDEIYTINKDSCGWFYGTDHDAIGIGYAEDIEELWHCIPESELIQYLAGRVGYAWHISDLVVYDKPKELSEFTKAKRLMSGCEIDCINCGFCKIKRPPQSWCYVEEMEVAQ